jgi:HAD superfamily hydrolase (TIGR01549 family)
MPVALADPDAVFFDIDNTLYDFDLSVRFTLEHLRDRFPDELGHHDARDLERRYLAANTSMSEKYRLSLIERDPFLYRRATWVLYLEREEAGVPPGTLTDPGPMERFLDPKDTEDLPARLARLFAEWRFRNLDRAAYPGAKDTILDLQDQGKPVGIITNGPAVFQRPKFEALGLRELIPEDLVLVSGEFGERKPHPSIFREAVRRADVPAEGIVYVGDSVECDVASKGVGMNFIFFDAARGPRPDFKAACGFEPDAIAHDYEMVRAYLGL